MIGSVNQDVAIQTRARGQLGTRGGGSRLLGPIGRRDARAGEIRAAVDLRRVIAAMAILAEPRHSRLEERGVARSVRRVTVGAIVGDRGVLPQVRSSLLGVAGEAGVVNRVPD